MNRAETYALEQPWVSGPFRWPREVNLKKWTIPDDVVFEEAEKLTEGIVMKLLSVGIPLEIQQIMVSGQLARPYTEAALRALLREGKVKRFGSCKWEIA